MQTTNIRKTDNMRMYSGTPKRSFYLYHRMNAFANRRTSKTEK